MTIPWFNIAVGWRDVLDILLVTALLYRVILMAQGTRAGAAMHGLLDREVPAGEKPRLRRAAGR